MNRFVCLGAPSARAGRRVNEGCSWIEILRTTGDSGHLPPLTERPTRRRHYTCRSSSPGARGQILLCFLSWTIHRQHASLVIPKPQEEILQRRFLTTTIAHGSASQNIDAPRPGLTGCGAREERIGKACESMASSGLKSIALSRHHLQSGF